MFATFLFVFFAVVAPVSADTFWEKATWAAGDGVILVGLYHPPARSKSYTWVLLHGLGSTKEEWNVFSRKLALQGNGIFIYDARGHGESNRMANGQTLSYQDWRHAGPESSWAKMPDDLARAVDFLKRHYDLSEKKIAVGGASLGANVALVYASDHSHVPALLLLSPGLEYAGISSPEAYSLYKGRPVLIAASPGDFYAYSSVQELAKVSIGPEQAVQVGKKGHGVQMFDPEFTKAVLDWMGNLDGNRNRRPS